ncbi:permease-like cell division protein FtsX [Scopulibacillus cellulosilyticus]|uniref:Cell division protein FtsX n=1 Tax=Scopulibacillus cellulosilyticus TaxID=2665665 RepID=A0ABW2Q303_9BACL
MKLRILRRHAREGVKNLGRNGWMTFASISAVTVSLILVGLFLTVMVNINQMAKQIENDVEVRVYVDPSANHTDQMQLKDKLEKVPDVQSVQYQSKTEGLNNLIHSMGKDGSVFADLKKENPLPDTFILKTKQPKQTITVANEVKHFQYVGQVRYGKGTVEKLFKFVGIARSVGIVLIVGLLFTSIFLIANTIKLTIMARRKEIEIMKLVGATNGFVRWPYFIEGLLLGILGSVIPILLILIGYRAVYEKLSSELSTFFLKLVPYSTMSLYLGILLFVIGAVIGVWGSLSSMRKFLKA